MAFHNAYVAYLDATLPDQQGAGNPGALRTEVTRLMPAAQNALNIAGISPTIYPPRAFGGPILNGLPNTAFAHESEPSGMMFARPKYEMILDVLRFGTSSLEERERVMRRKRRNPLYWGDRILRVVLGFPTYVLSLVIGVPVSRIEDSPWGAFLRAAELIAGGLGVYFGGQAAGWW